MKGTVYIARRKGELDAATPKVTARPQSEAWWADCLRDGGTVLEIAYDVIDYQTIQGSGVRVSVLRWHGCPDGARRVEEIDVTYDSC